MKRKEILDEAARIVTGERQNQYGSAENSFALIGGLWGDYLGMDISPRDVALMMILLKVAREKGGKGKADNWIDIAGYAACGGEVATETDKPTGNKDPLPPYIVKMAEENEKKRELLRAIFGTAEDADKSETDSIADIVKKLREISDDLYRAAHDLEENEDDED